jgi:hydroxymethylpyrimidine pyrophosphatase-like HAD family hydrolase
MAIRDRVFLAVVDIDGCLTPGEGRAWDWRALRAIGDLNQRAAGGEETPAVTVCTGRQEPYAEAMMQAIGAFLPGIYENGCGLYFPTTYRFVEHPSITEETKEALAAARAALRSQIVAPGLGIFQPGKESSLTLYPLPGTSVSGLYQAVAGVLAGRDALFTVQASVSCVDVMPSGLDKGTGVRWLVEETGIALAQVGGIGDSTSDLAYLRLVGTAAAPANATDEVKAVVSYVSVHEDGAGVVDILEHWRGTDLRVRWREM